MKRRATSVSKTFPKGYDITDDGLIFINDELGHLTYIDSEGYRRFSKKVRITITQIIEPSPPEDKL